MTATGAAATEYKITVISQIPVTEIQISVTGMPHALRRDVPTGSAKGMFAQIAGNVSTSGAPPGGRRLRSTNTFRSLAMTCPGGTMAPSPGFQPWVGWAGVAGARGGY